MKNISNEEKCLKRYLKNKISLNTETVVKFLITGMVLGSLTACGGGGGNSSNPIPPVVDQEPPIPEPPLVEEVEINKNNEGHSIVGENVKVSGTIKADTNSTNLIGIKAENSNVESNANVILNGDGNIGIYGTTRNARSLYSIKNTGTIEVTGKNSIGMSGENGVLVENNGTIIGKGQGLYQQNPDGTIIANDSGTIGILVNNGSKGINNKDILLDGTYTKGMQAINGSIIENNGKISMKSKIVRESELWEGEYYDEEVYSREGGLRAENKSTAINNGLITGSGRITGIEVKSGSRGENNGTIQLESLRQDAEIVVDYGDYFVYLQDEKLGKVRGLRAREKDSIVINNKDIQLSGEAIGMQADSKGKAMNNGNIQLVSQNIKTRGYAKGGEPYDWKYKEVGTTYSELIGMFAKTGTIENREIGNISLLGSGYGMRAILNSVGINNGNILAEAKAELWSESVGVNDPDPTELRPHIWAPIVGMEANESKIVNNKEITVLNDGQGMKAKNNSTAINNGNIVMMSKISNENGDYIDWNYHIIGMELENSVGINNGNILITGKAEHKGVSVDGISSFSNKGKIEIETENSFARGIGGSTENEITNDGIIRVFTNKSNQNTYYRSVNAMGISTDGDIINNKDIYVATEGGTATGINSIRNVINNVNGKIVVAGDNPIGIQASNGRTQESAKIISIKNEGLILVNGKTGIIPEGDMSGGEIPTGIQAFNYAGQSNKGLITNNNKIEVESLDIARGIDSYGNDVVNNGIISVKGIDAEGIRVQAEGAIATNNGTINVYGKGSFGMYAGMDSTAINSETGIINVSATAEGGMFASGQGAKVINKGTINIANRDGLNESNKESIALKSSGGGVIENYGTINIDGNLTLNSTNSGRYVIGTNKDGAYGKISAKNVSIDGDIIVSTEITKNGFKNEYTMQNIVDAENISLGDNFNFTSNSLLYDAKAVTDTWGNLDATLIRNNRTLSDFTTGYITSTANIFGKYQTEEMFKTLNEDAKEVVKAIDASSVEAIDRSLNSLTPTIYSNLGRQILETSETFKEQDMVAINSLGENTYNFTFIGEYQDVSSRNNIEGYKGKLTGFVGAMNFGDSIFGTLGYTYNNIDYKENGKGNIQTIHLGFNKFMKYQGVDLKLGLGGEYNFHENKRDIDLVSRRAESDFDSYGVRASGEVSKIFGEKISVKPYLGFDLAHMKYDSFTESNANSLNATVESENYTSVLPKVGLLVGNRFGGLDLFAGIEYSYELGNMDKEQEFSYEGFSGKGNLPKDDLECGTTGVKLGANYGVNNFTLGVSLGKNFGRRDNSFVDFSLGYTF